MTNRIPIATRTLHRKQGDSVGDVVVEIFAPKNDDNERGPAWKCEYRIMGLATPVDRYVLGVDAIQTLELCLQTIGVDLSISSEAKAGELFWFEPKDQLGFPIPKSSGIGSGRV